MDISAILSLAAVAVSLVGLLLSSRKTTRDDAASNAEVKTMLGSISSGVEDIRVEMRTMRGRVDGLAERLSAVESSCKSAHHRLDQLHAHPPD